MFVGPGGWTVIEKAELLQLDLLPIRHLAEHNRRRIMETVPACGGLERDEHSLGALLPRESLLWLYGHLRTLSHGYVERDWH